MVPKTDHDENGNEVEQPKKIVVADNEKPILPQKLYEALPDFLTRKVEFPYMNTYHWYYKKLPRSEEEKLDEGYAMCPYNPCHIIKGKGLQNHAKNCPDRFIDDEIMREMQSVNR